MMPTKKPSDFYQTAIALYSSPLKSSQTRSCSRMSLEVAREVSCFFLESLFDKHIGRFSDSFALWRLPIGVPLQQ